jgi:hypothetical protein
VTYRRPDWARSRQAAHDEVDVGSRTKAAPSERPERASYGQVTLLVVNAPALVSETKEHVVPSGDLSTTPFPAVPTYTLPPLT